MEKTINEDKRQKTWGLRLETSSELELDGGQGTPQASGPWDATGLPEAVSASWVASATWVAT